MPLFLKTMSLGFAIFAAATPVWTAEAATPHRHRGAVRHVSQASKSAHVGARGAGPVDDDVSPAGASARTTAATGGEDGGAGGYGKVGNPYSQAGYGAGAFGNGRPSR